MYAVVNHFPLRRPVDDELRRKLREDLLPQARAYPGFRAFHLVEVSPEEMIVVGLFETREALDRSTVEVAAPWFQEHVGPYVAGPPARSVGAVVVSTDEVE